MMRPPVRRSPGGSKPSTARAAIVLPLPDSPTTARILAARDRERDVVDDLAPVRAAVDAAGCRRVEQRRRASSMPHHPRVETVAQGVAEQVDAEQRQRDADARRDASQAALSM